MNRTGRIAAIAGACKASLPSDPIVGSSPTPSTTQAVARALLTCPTCQAVWGAESTALIKQARGLVKSELLDPRHRPRGMVRQLIEDWHAEGHPRS